MNPCLWQWINAFEWISPSEVKEILCDCVELMEFEKVQDIFGRQIEVKGVFNEEYNIASRNIVVEEVKLELMSIAQENNSEEFVLVPAWDFFGYTELICDSKEVTQLPLNDDNTFCYRNYR